MSTPAEPPQRMPRTGCANKSRVMPLVIAGGSVEWENLMIGQVLNLAILRQGFMSNYHVSMPGLLENYWTL